LASLAVPFFFAVSGFYLYHSDYNQQIRRIKKRLRRLGLILPWIFLLWVGEQIVLHQTYLFNPTVFWGIIWFNGATWIGRLWFIPALIVCDLIFLLNAKYLKRDSGFLSCP
jgi:fucose 4-O-acetylase-like acetyltransferase